jgi:predicted nuclease of predicted toxin-antitoxin system
MKILFDQGTPAPLRHTLQEHTVTTAYELGWAALDNGELLAAAESVFDALVTTDQNLRYQQSLAGRRLAILVLPTTNWPELRAHEAQIVAAINTLRPGEIVELKI